MKIDNKDKKLIKKAKEVVRKAKRFGEKKVGNAGCALITKKKNFYCGVCLDLDCGLGGCAEKAAIFNMITNGETEIDSIVTVSKNKILPPCGTCREIIMQVNKKNTDTNVIISKLEKIKLKDLIPHRRGKAL